MSSGGFGSVRCLVLAMLCALACACDRGAKTAGDGAADAGSHLGPNAVALAFAEAMRERDTARLTEHSGGHLRALFERMHEARLLQEQLVAAIREAAPGAKEDLRLRTIEQTWTGFFRMLFGDFELDGLLREEGDRRVYQVKYRNANALPMYNEMTLEKAAAWKVVAIEEAQLDPDKIATLVESSGSLEETVPRAIERLRAEGPFDTLNEALTIVQEEQNAVLERRAAAAEKNG